MIASPPYQRAHLTRREAAEQLGMTTQTFDPLGCPHRWTRREGDHEHYPWCCIWHYGQPTEQTHDLAPIPVLALAQLLLGDAELPEGVTALRPTGSQQADAWARRREG